MPSPNSIWYKLLCVALIVTFFINITAVHYLKHPGSYGRSDFAVFYATGKLLQTDHSPYDKPLLKKTIKRYRSYNAGWSYLYPPMAGLLFVPLAMLKFKTAVWVWYGFSVLCLVGIVWCVRILINRRFTYRDWTAVILLCGLYGPLFTNLRLGQVNVWLAFLFIGHLIAVRKNKTWLAAAALSIMILTKLFPGILLFYYVLRRQWSVLGATAVMTTVISLVSLLVLGSGLHWEFLSVMQQTASSGIGHASLSMLAHFDNATIYGATLRIVSILTGGSFPDWGVTLGHSLRVIIGLGLAGLLTVATWRRRHLPASIYETSFWIGLVLLVATEIHTQYYLYLLPLLLVLNLTPPSIITTLTQRVWILLATILISFSYMQLIPLPLRDTPVTVVSYALLGHLIILTLMLPWRLTGRQSQTLLDNNTKLKN